MKAEDIDSIKIIWLSKTFKPDHQTSVVRNSKVFSWDVNRLHVLKHGDSTFYELTRKEAEGVPLCRLPFHYFDDSTTPVSQTVVFAPFLNQRPISATAVFSVDRSRQIVYFEVPVEVPQGVSGSLVYSCDKNGSPLAILGFVSYSSNAPQATISTIPFGCLLEPFGFKKLANF